MQNPPVPEPSNPNPTGGYETYPSAPSAGVPAPSYSQPYAQQPPAYDGQGYAQQPPAYDAQAQGYTPPAYTASQQAPAFSQPQGPNFFKALFDLSFSSYITVTFAKIIYIVLIAMCVLTWLFMVFTGFSQDAIVGFMLLLFGWIPAFIYIILIRLGLEASVALIRTAQNTSKLVSQDKQG